MTEHWNEHSLDFSRRSDKKFDSAEGNWDDANKTGFTIDPPVTEDDMKVRRQDYEKTNPDVENLQRRQGYTNQVRADKSYRFLMMVAAFSKKKLGTIMNVKRRLSTTVTNTSEKSGQMYFNIEANRYGSDTTAHFANNTNTKESGTKVEFDGMEDNNDDNDEVGENTGKVGGQAWLTMPEISGSIQLTPEVYGHIVEAQTIVESFSNRPITLKDLVETPRYQTLFARLVAIRMGLTKYFYSSDKQKDRIFSRLHQEQSMLLRRIRIVKRKPTRDFTGAGSY